MTLSRLRKAALLACLCAFQASAVANVLEEYQIYEADVDGDTDYLLKLSPEEVEIPYDINLQLERSAQQYLLTKEDDGSFTVTAVNNPNASWALIEGDFTAINYTAGGELEVAIRTYGTDPQVIITNQTSDGVLATGASVASQSLENSALASIVDLNSDGLDDVVIAGDQVNALSSAGASVSLKHEAIQNLAPKTWAGTDGAAHAAINIYMPKELGPVPSISLQYSSNAGNGPVGVGFNLTGTSKIHYCRPAADVDGTMAATPFTDEERLCLDGQYLVQTAGASRFEDNATYMTEISNHARIRYVNDSSQNKFEMQVKGGGKLIFAHARKHDQDLTKTIEWYLTRAEDEFGNGYDYSYKYATQHQYLPLLEKIEYGSITVDILWEARAGKQAHDNSAKSTSFNDEYVAHRGGASTVMRDRLLDITVNRDSTKELRKYLLKYGVNYNGQSQLEAVTVCALNASCIDSLFNWHEGLATFSTPTSLGVTTKKEEQKAQFLDINGDGYVDVMYPSTSGQWKFKLGSVSGFGIEKPTGITIGSGVFADYATPIKSGYDHIQGLLVADPKVGGKLQSILACVNGENIHAYASTAEQYADTKDLTFPNCESVAGGELQYIPRINWYVLHAEFTDGTFSKFNYQRLGVTDADKNNNNVNGLSTLGNRLTVTDVNKDGQQDIIVNYEAEIIDYWYRLYGYPYVQAAGERISVFIADAHITGATTSRISYNEFTVTEPVNGSFDGSLNFVDLNHDGILDIERCSEDNTSFSCNQYMMNFNNDKYTEYMACLDDSSCASSLEHTDIITAQRQGVVQPSNKKTKSVEYTDSATGSKKTKYMLSPNYYADFNGDGATDKMQLTAAGMVVEYSLHNPENETQKYTVVNYAQIQGDPFKIRLLDYNADGLTDVLAEDDGALKLFQAVRVAATGSYGRNIDYIEQTVLDSNPIPSNSAAGIEYSEMLDSSVSSSDIVIKLLPVLQYKDMPTPMDYNGDGITDLVYFDGQELFTTQRANNFVNTSKLHTITDSFGNQTKFTYQKSQLEPNTDYDDIRFPYVNIANTTGLVSKMEYGNEQTGYRATDYTFSGAQYHLQGRGFMGYGKRTSTTQISANETIKSVEEFEQHFPIAGAAKKQSQYWTDKNAVERLLSSSTNNWLSKNLTQFSSSIHMPYLQSTVSEQRELNGIKTGSSSATLTHDDFGNVLTQYKYNRNGANALLASHSVINKYQHSQSGSNDDIDNWRVSFLTQSKSTRTASGKTTIQTSDFTPKGNTHLVGTKIDLVGSQQELKHTYGYNDATGVLLSESLTSGAGVTHSITTKTPFTNSNFEHGYLPKTIQNATGKNATLVYDTTWHKPTKQTSVQGLSQQTSYDNWGSAYKTLSPQGAINLSLTNLCAANCPAGAYYVSTQLQMHKSQKGFLAPPQFTYYSALGRVLREESLNANKDSIIQDYQYNLYGRLTQASLPHVKGTSSDDIKWVTYDEYDALNRNLQISYPDGGAVNNTFVGSTTGTTATKTITNQLPQPTGGTEQQITTTQTNAMGQVTQVENPQSGLKNTYVYDALSNLRTASVYEGTSLLKQVTATYNTAGLKTQINDPDTGIYNYQYDGLGLMRKQTDSRSNSYVYSYDKLNQQTQSTLNGTLDATWVYSDAIPGLLTQRYKSGFNESYKYDALHRIKQVSTQLKNLAARQFKYTYDAAGRMLQTHYPSGFSVQTQYNPQGFLIAYQNPKTQDNYWQAQTMDAFGNWVGERMGNGIQTQRVYDPASGMLASIKSTKSTEGDIQNLDYTWDSNGNLRSRTQGALAEAFSYDGVNRLTQAHTTGLVTTGTRTLSYQYSALGNMTYKSDLSDVNGMTYGTQTGTGINAGPSRLLSVNKDNALLYSYRYDGNGNMTQRGNVNASYTAANKPSKIWAGNSASYQENSFLYDTDEQRFYQAQKQGTNTVRETYYYGSGYEEVFDISSDTDSQTLINTHKQKAYVGGVMIHTYTQSDDASELGKIIGKRADIQYLHHDHLGSTQTITHADGHVLQSLAYDPFGKARNKNWEDVGVASETDPDWGRISLSHTSTGFTGHEMLADFDLIHMGGRLYDPIAGRMMSADPFVQAPFFGQSYNRYSYTWNNPLSLIDPSGYVTFAPVNDGSDNNLLSQISNNNTISQQFISNSINWNLALNYKLDTLNNLSADVKVELASQGIDINVALAGYDGPTMSVTDNMVAELDVSNIILNAINGTHNDGKFGISYNGHKTFIANDEYEMNLGYGPIGELKSACSTDICSMGAGPKLPLNKKDSIDLTFVKIKGVEQAFIQYRNMGLKQVEYYMPTFSISRGVGPSIKTGRSRTFDFITRKVPIWDTEFDDFGIQIDVFGGLDSEVIGIDY